MGRKDSRSYQWAKFGRLGLPGGGSGVVRHNNKIYLDLPLVCKICAFFHPKNLPTLGIQSPCQRIIGVSNHLLSKVFRFHYHSQKVIGSLGQKADFFLNT